MLETQEPKYGVTATGRIFDRATMNPIPDDEPVFIFRARDVHAVAILEAYQGLLTVQKHAEAVEVRINDFTRFAQEHPERMHEPGSDAPPTVKKPAPGKGGKYPTLVSIVVAPSHLVGLDIHGVPWIMPLAWLGTERATWDQLPLPGEL